MHYIPQHWLGMACLQVSALHEMNSLMLVRRGLNLARNEGQEKCLYQSWVTLYGFGVARWWGSSRSSSLGHGYVGGVCDMCEDGNTETVLLWMWPRYLR